MSSTVGVCSKPWGHQAAPAVLYQSVCCTQHQRCLLASTMGDDVIDQPHTHPKTARAAAVAVMASSGAAPTKPAINAVTEQPVAVIFGSMATPLSTANTTLPSVTCMSTDQVVCRWLSCCQNKEHKALTWAASLADSRCLAVSL